MGYSFDSSKRLCCDNCGQAGGVRKRTCPHKVRTDSSRSPRHMLAYCYPPAVCVPCWTPELRVKVHGDCAAGAARSQAGYDANEARMAAGDLMVVSASTDPCRPGMTVVTMAAPWRDGNVRWTDYLVPAGDYNGRGGFLSEFPHALTVATCEAFEVAVDGATVADRLAAAGIITVSLLHRVGADRNECELYASVDVPPHAKRGQTVGKLWHYPAVGDAPERWRAYRNGTGARAGTTNSRAEALAALDLRTADMPITTITTIADPNTRPQEVPA